MDIATGAVSGPGRRLGAMIEADITHMTTHPDRFRALTEISFHRYSEAGTMQFLGDEELLVVQKLRGALAAYLPGGRDLESLAIIIEGARDSYLARYSHGDQSVAPTVFTEALLSVINMYIKEDLR